MTEQLSQQTVAVSNPKISVKLRAATKPGALKAHAEVRIDFAHSALEILGLSVIHHDPTKPAWVSYPQRAGNNGKYYAIVRLSGRLHDTISAAVLDEFGRMPAPGLGTGCASIPHEPGEDDIPF